MPTGRPADPATPRPAGVELAVWPDGPVAMRSSRDPGGPALLSARAEIEVLQALRRGPYLVSAGGSSARWAASRSSHIATTCAVVSVAAAFGSSSAAW